MSELGAVALDDKVIQITLSPKRSVRVDYLHVSSRLEVHIDGCEIDTMPLDVHSRTLWKLQIKRDKRDCVWVGYNNSHMKMLVDNGEKDYVDAFMDRVGKWIALVTVKARELFYRKAIVMVKDNSSALVHLPNTLIIQSIYNGHDVCGDKYAVGDTVLISKKEFTSFYENSWCETHVRLRGKFETSKKITQFPFEWKTFERSVYACSFLFVSTTPVKFSMRELRDKPLLVKMTIQDGPLYSVIIHRTATNKKTTVFRSKDAQAARNFAESLCLCMAQFYEKISAKWKDKNCEDLPELIDAPPIREPAGMELLDNLMALDQTARLELLDRLLDSPQPPPRLIASSSY